MPNDKEAIQELKQGNLHGLKSLTERYQLTAIRAAFLILQDEEAAKDIAVDAFLRAYEKIDSFDLDRPFSPWFFTIVTNLARRAAVNRSKNPGFSDWQAENKPDPQPDPARQVERTELNHALQNAIGKLSARQREILIQRYYLHMSIKEIAKAHHLPEGTVKWRLSKGRKALKNYLQPYDQKE